ncbi:MAG: hypothetical protein R6V62_01810, partial [Candidatus Fermentibacteraceae bacterium]
DGTIVAWGHNEYGQSSVPYPNDDFVAIACGGLHSLGVRDDGTIEAWGFNEYYQCEVPYPNEGFIAVAGGRHHSLGVRDDGTIVAWGSNYNGQCDVPFPNEDFVAVAAGYGNSLGLKNCTTGIANPRPGSAPGSSGLVISSVAPNPFNSFAEISFETLSSGSMNLDIFDLYGRCIETAQIGFFAPGVHQVRWDGQDDLASGVYFIRLRCATGGSEAVKALLIR